MSTQHVPQKPPGKPKPGVGLAGGNKGNRATVKAGGAKNTSHHAHIAKKPSLDDTIDHVFSILKDRSEESGGTPIPPKFFYFYDSDMFRHFLACVVYYFYGFTNVRNLEADYASEASEGLKKQIASAQRVLKHRLQMFAEAYSRLLLHCSNFENTIEDQSFFEFLFEFTMTTCRMAVAEDQWDTINEALGHVFRGHMFNTDALRSPRDGSSKSKQKTFLEKSKNQEQQKDGREDGENSTAEEHQLQLYEKPKTTTVERRAGKGPPDQVKAILREYSRKTHDEFHKVATRLKKNTSKAQSVIENARALIAKHKLRVTRVPRAKRVREKHREMSKLENLSKQNETRMGLASEVVSSRDRDFSVQRAFHARSPMISLLLPTAIERLEISQVKRSHALRQRKRRKLERMKIDKSVEPESGSDATAKKAGKAQQRTKNRYNGVLSS